MLTLCFVPHVQCAGIILPSGGQGARPHVHIMTYSFCLITLLLDVFRKSNPQSAIIGHLENIELEYRGATSAEKAP